MSRELNPLQTVKSIASNAASAAEKLSKNAARTAAATADGAHEAIKAIAESDLSKTIKNAGDGIAQVKDNATLAAAKNANSAANAISAGVHSASEAAAVGAKIAADAAESATSAVAEAAESAKNLFDRKRQEMLAEKIDEFMPQAASARKKLDGTAAASFLAELGESPLPPTYDTDTNVKRAFPVPKEQTVIWADAEFDLRPSGVAITESGVYVKTDSAVFATKENIDSTKSQLFYFAWNGFEPECLGGKDGSNPLSKVAPPHGEGLLSVCRNLSAAHEAKSQAAYCAPTERQIHTNNALVGGFASAAAAANAPVQTDTAKWAAVNMSTGHGFYAEQAMTLLDKLHGRNAAVIGGDFAKNGADRFVDGIGIQTKFYSSPRGSLNAAFDPVDGLYRYINKDGSPMQLEVPKDQYAKVLEGFAQKIRENKVPGVHDPSQASAIVRKGSITYRQAVNLAKPMTIDSLRYDVSTGAVVSTCAFGISFLTSSFFAYRRTRSTKESVYGGLSSGFRVFGTTMAQHVLASQLSRTAVAKVVSSTVLRGAAAMAVLSVPETIKLAQRKSSTAQYAKNMAGLAGSVAGGAAGAKAGAALGTAITPGVGTAVGIAGGAIGGIACGMAAGAIGDIVYEGDSAAFERYFNAMFSCMSAEYCLDENEMDKTIEELNALSNDEFKRIFETTMRSNSQEQIVRHFLTPIFEKVISRRERFVPPTNEEVVSALNELEKSEVNTKQSTREY